MNSWPWHCYYYYIVSFIWTNFIIKFHYIYVWYMCFCYIIKSGWLVGCTHHIIWCGYSRLDFLSFLSLGWFILILEFIKRKIYIESLSIGGGKYSSRWMCLAWVDGWMKKILFWIVFHNGIMLVLILVHNHNHHSYQIP